MSVTGQQRFGRAAPRSRQAKGSFCVFVCLFLQVPSQARLCQPAREANGGTSIDPTPSPSHNHVDCRISSSTYHRPEFPGARLAALCSARGMAQTFVLLLREAGRTGARQRAAPRFGMVFYSLPRGWKPHKTQALASFFSPGLRYPQWNMEYRVPCMQYMPASYRN